MNIFGNKISSMQFREVLLLVCCSRKHLLCYNYFIYNDIAIEFSNPASANDYRLATIIKSPLP